MKRYSLILLVMMAISCTKSEHIQNVTVEEMETLLLQDKVQLVDVRTLAEYKQGFIKDAQNIDYFSDTFEADILKLDKTKPVLLYCQKGGRSAKCAKKLEALGFKKIYDLKGGYSKWKSI